MIDIAIVIVVRNRNDRRFKMCLRSLLRQQTSCAWEIYVIDYGSTDNLPTMLGELSSDKINYLYVNKEPFNKGHGHNIGIRAVDAHHVLFIDPSCIFQNNLLETVHMQGDYSVMLKDIRKAAYVPENIVEDDEVDIVEDFELYMNQPDVLEENGVGLGPKGKRVFAVEQEVLLRIRGFNEDLLNDDEVDIVRRSLLAGAVLVNISDKVGAAYLTSSQARSQRAEEGLAKQKDVHHAEAMAAWRKGPVVNLNREWGQI